MSHKLEEFIKNPGAQAFPLRNNSDREWIMKKAKIIKEKRRCFMKGRKLFLFWK